ncbi:phosphatidate cytidylyltransferase [Phenylobacterium sp. LH3H17]|uniref:phosphatidate cytidylyltransferase n=1 Tax=Phenylobacterium sp. LH3H17 TaxID=2903901 RepID=UPI0020C9E64D|nr:phosphatidate cytidylyltransferase [Phenylobacterium sp. LH3H17]UTP40599.1 phosphatidate cytidylyltransferase [Phenylobacterium sp. LH3H17]
MRVMLVEGERGISGMDAITAFFGGQPPALLWGLGGVLAVLTLAVGITLLLPRLKPGGDFTNLRQRISSWWVMIALLAAALLAGWQAVTALFVVVSFIALREFLSLAPVRREDRPIVLAAFAAMLINYGFIVADDYGLYRVFIPTYVFLIVPFLMACIGQTRAFLATTATFHWAIVTCVYNLGYIAFLMRTPASEPLPAGAAGLVFFLLVATEANDVAQYVWGKLFGKRKIVPKVSPNKTWEGFLGGWATTAALIWFLGPVFSPLSGLGLACLAIFLPIAGFAGDVTMSAIKRDIGVKDTSALIPGHGGLLDRADSLTFTAPLFFHIHAYFALSHF